MKIVFLFIIHQLLFPLLLDNEKWMQSILLSGFCTHHCYRLNLTATWFHFMPDNSMLNIFMTLCASCVPAGVIMWPVSASVKITCSVVAAIRSSLDSTSLLWITTPMRLRMQHLDLWVTVTFDLWPADHMEDEARGVFPLGFVLGLHL